MDEAFLIRARRMLGAPKRLPLDHESFVAKIFERQAATPTARLATGVKDSAPVGETDSAATLIKGADGWRGARAAQDGCFNRAVAARPLNTP